MWSFRRTEGRRGLRDVRQLEVSAAGVSKSHTNAAADEITYDIPNGWRQERIANCSALAYKCPKSARCFRETGQYPNVEKAI
jgi:hypothetical protein